MTSAISALPDHRFVALRVLWIVYTALVLVILVKGLPYRFDEFRTVCGYGAECNYLQLEQVEVGYLQDYGWTLEAYARYQTGAEVFFAASSVLFALFIFLRKPADRFGWLVAFAFVGFGASMGVEADRALVLAEPSWRGLHNLAQAAAYTTLVLFLYLFPNGSFAHRWARPVLPVLAALAISIAFFVDIQSSTPAARMLFVPFVLIVAGGVASQYYRYRYVSTPTERQQTKWMVVGFVSILIGIVGWVIPLEVLVIGPSEARLLYFIGLMAAWVLLWSFVMTLLAIAILKYRLWDIDVLINRALVYGLLTATSAAAYFGGVIVLQGIFRGVTGQESGLEVVVSTLVVAGLFVPLRRRVQGLIDRRFYRSRYDAERTLSAFGETARDEVNLERLSGALVGAVSDTMQPTHTSLWLRESARGNGRRNDSGTLAG